MSSIEHEEQNKEYNYRFVFHVYNIGDVVKTTLLKVRDGEQSMSPQYNTALFMQVAGHFEKKGWGVANMNYSSDYAVMYVIVDDDEAWAEGVPTGLEVKA
ncbi:hypothetical protein BKA70DRAFT_1429205 [Coprinopsis sp. MPI-PUGE-AT-0042]|nr:hypothetical protein BKA70DRAFT_1429205 [Coprinopsis sp. MPI-PUGE-AT-0042]